MKKDINQSFIQKFINPESPLSFIGYLGLSTLTGWLVTFNTWAIFISAILAIVWYFEVKQNQKRNKQNFDNLIASFVPENAKPLPSPGLILLLSPYSPRKRELSEDTLKPLINKILESTPEQLTKELFEEINLFKSNLAPQIAAIDFHSQDKKLRDVWLISTKTDSESVGSENSVIILKKYLEFKYSSQLTIHDRGLSVSDSNYLELYQTVDRIFRDKETPYRESHIIADITGGTKMMSIALALACIPFKRKLQYMDSIRDWEGKPLQKGDMKPILIDVDPNIPEQF